MKALTLYQPHATLVAIGAKRVETRKLKWGYRGPLAIHASLSNIWLDLCAEEPFRSVLAAAGFCGPADLPLGKIVCVTSIRDCVSADRVPLEKLRYSAAPHEIAFGNYRPGRFAYVLGDVRRLHPPLLATGHQGLWEWVDPDEPTAPQFKQGELCLEA